MKINEQIWLYSVKREHGKKLDLIFFDKLAEVNIKKQIVILCLSCDKLIWVIIFMHYATYTFLSSMHYCFVYLKHSITCITPYVFFWSYVYYSMPCVSHLCWYMQDICSAGSFLWLLSYVPWHKYIFLMSPIPEYFCCFQIVTAANILSCVSIYLWVEWLNKNICIS